MNRGSITGDCWYTGALCNPAIGPRSNRNGAPVPTSIGDPKPDYCDPSSDTDMSSLPSMSIMYF